MEGRAMVSMPPLGFGLGSVWSSGYDHNTQGDIHEPLVQVLLTALRQGFTHFDLAEMYGNDRELAAALRESGVPRESLWVTSKVWQSFRDVEQQCRRTLSALACAYLDLYLIHAPPRLHPSRLPVLQVWKAMERLVRLGLVRRIGISNFQVEDIEELFESGEVDITPSVHQIRFNPCRPQEAVRACSLRYGMQLVAYGCLGPLADGAAAGPLAAYVRALADHHGTSPAGVLHRYAHQHGFAVITTTRNISRIPELLSPFKTPQNSAPFTLSEEEMVNIDQLGKDSILIHESESESVSDSE